MPDNFNERSPFLIQRGETPIERVEVNALTASPVKIDRTPSVKLADFSVEARHSPTLAAVTDSGVVYAFNWQPDFYLVVARLTVGSINIHIGGSRNASQSFRLVSGTLKLPVHVDTLTIESVGATGVYDIYAVRNLDGFEIVG